MGPREAAIDNVPDSNLLVSCREAGIGLLRAEPAELRFEDVFQNYRQMVFSLVYRLTGNHDDALEITQEIFVTVYRKLHTFRGEASVKTWLYRICLNRVANQLRWWKTRRRSQTISLQGLGDFDLVRLNLCPTFGPGNPEQTCIGTEFEENLQLCLGRLAVKYRLVLVLRDIEGLSYEEIAESLQLSVGTVKSRLARAREKLRELMDRYL